MTRKFPDWRAATGSGGLQPLISQPAGRRILYFRPLCRSGDRRLIFHPATCHSPCLGYSAGMTTAYDEVIGFIARGLTPGELLRFRPSDEACARLEHLIRKEKADGLLPEEREELDRTMEAERVLSLAKAKARAEQARVPA